LFTVIGSGVSNTATVLLFLNSTTLVEKSCSNELPAPVKHGAQFRPVFTRNIPRAQPQLVVKRRTIEDRHAIAGHEMHVRIEAGAVLLGGWHGEQVREMGALAVRCDSQDLVVREAAIEAVIPLPITRAVLEEH
jgi:hypothetical protein